MKHSTLAKLTRLTGNGAKHDFWVNPEYVVFVNQPTGLMAGKGAQSQMSVIGIEKLVYLEEPPEAIATKFGQ